MCALTLRAQLHAGPITAHHPSIHALSMHTCCMAAQLLSAALHAAWPQDNGLAEREGIEMRVVGDLSVPPPGVQGAAARLMANTAKLPRKRAVLNICFSYR